LLTKHTERDECQCNNKRTPEFHYSKKFRTIIVEKHQYVTPNGVSSKTCQLSISRDMLLFREDPSLCIGLFDKKVKVSKVDDLYRGS